MSPYVSLIFKRFLLIIPIILFLVAFGNAQHSDSTAAEHQNKAISHAEQVSHQSAGINLGEDLALWWAIPFAGILLSIALF
ncbi:MAG: hypothetical protein KAR38_03660, partial [Calditrichia bacterium]|nr:hypothetical protein [Calditrichia bacterium]